jgi:hypothetical protein
MVKNNSKQQRRRQEQDPVIKILALKHGVSAGYVNKIIRGDRNNELIFSEYMAYREERNLLLEAVKRAVPFEN